jgi:hypothetical protein
MKFWLIILLLTVSLSNYAQDQGKMKDKVNAHKIAYLTDRIGLTEQEAQRFWPVYNQYQTEKELLKNQGIRPVSADLSEKESDDQLARYLDYRVREAEAQRKYIEKLRGFISSKKILLLLDAERTFKVEILNKMSDKCKVGG